MPETAAETAALLGQVRSLELKLELAEKKARELNERPMFVGKDKRIKSFSTKDDVSEWVESVAHYVNQRFRSDDDKKEFILDHIEREPKLELRLHLDLSGADADQILQMLNTIFSSKATLIQVQQQFFARNQSSSESLEDFSYQLMDLALQLKKLKPSVFQNMEDMLKEKFAEGVRDKALKRELRRLNKESSTLKFYELRDRARAWSSEDVDVDSELLQEAVTGASSQPVSAKSDDPVTSKVLDLLEKHEKSIDKLSESLKQMGSSSGRGRGRYRNDRRGRGAQNYGSPNKRSDNNDPPGEIICHHCKGPNHYARDCLKKKAELRQKHERQGGADADPLNP